MGYRRINGVTRGDGYPLPSTSSWTMMYEYGWVFFRRFHWTQKKGKKHRSWCPRPSRLQREHSWWLCCPTSRERCYRINIYNKILDRDWFFARHLSPNRRFFTWVSNYRYPIWIFCNWTLVIGYPRDLHINYALFIGFLRTVSYSFQNFWKALQTSSLKRNSQKTFLIAKFVIDTIN